MNATAPHHDKPKIVFFGSPAFALLVAEALHEAFEIALVVSQPDKPAGRGMRLTPPPVAAWARENGLQLLQPKRLKNNAEFLRALKDSGAEVGLTCAYGRVLPPEVLSAFEFGVFNTHTSLLPSHRGAAPIQWALIEGDVRTGTTIMQTDEGMDTGAILLQESLPIFPHWTAIELAEALGKQAAKLAVEAVQQRRELRPTPQDDSKATHARLLTKEDGFVRWHESARAICNRHRGVAAWPQTTAFVDGDRVKLFGLSVKESRRQIADRRGGRILDFDGDSILVETGGNELRIQQVQEAGARPVAAAVWAKNRWGDGLSGAAFDLHPDAPQGE